MSTIFNRKAAFTAIYTERYVLSLVFLYLAWIEFHKPWDSWAGWAGQPAIESAVLIEDARHINGLLLNLFTGLLLLVGRRVDVLPQKLKYILVPLASISFYLMYNFVSWFPTSLQKNLCPHDLQMPAAIASIAFITMGPMVTMWSILYLGRSFGIFVMVRKVVFRGPYQWVRHPMYLGWIGVCIGIALTYTSWAYFILVAVHISLLLYRARLEETELSKYSAEYREYMKRTGFIIPRFRRPPGTSSEAK
jgi:protein-S-isoprenylcysteine O-methyltransferase Ste14